MSDRGDPTKAGSRIIRERAMSILRDTRAKIDPALLAAMKERLSSIMPGSPQPPPTANAAPKEAELKQGLFKREYEAQLKAAQPEPEVPDEVVDENGMVQVDKQKIAQIVLQYMKNRDDKQKH